MSEQAKMETAADVFEATRASRARANAEVMGELDSGIRNVVAWMQAHGFTTTDSGDGVSKLGGDMQDVLPFPHVVAVVAPDAMVSEARRLAGLLRDAGIDVHPNGHDKPEIDARYDPADGTAVIILCNVNDAVLAGQ